jgi:hypothetical protein
MTYQLTQILHLEQMILVSIILGIILFVIIDITLFLLWIGIVKEYGKQIK